MKGLMRGAVYVEFTRPYTLRKLVLLNDSGYSQFQSCAKSEALLHKPELRSWRRRFGNEDLEGDFSDAVSCLHCGRALYKAQISPCFSRASGTLEPVTLYTTPLPQHPCLPQANNGHVEANEECSLVQRTSHNPALLLHPHLSRYFIDQVVKQANNPEEFRQKPAETF